MNTLYRNIFFFKYRLLGKTLTISWKELCGRSMAVYVDSKTDPVSTLNKDDLDKGNFTYEIDKCGDIPKEQE